MNHRNLVRSYTEKVQNALLIFTRLACLMNALLQFISAHTSHEHFDNDATVYFVLCEITKRQKAV